MSAEASTPASTRLAAMCSPNRNASGIVSFWIVAAAVTTRSRMCTTSTFEPNALASPVTTGTSSAASSGPPTATRIFENISPLSFDTPLPRRELFTRRYRIGCVYGRTRAALPGRAEETPWRMGALPEGQLRPPRTARQPRAGGGGRRGGGRGPALAAVRLERRVPGAVRDSRPGPARRHRRRSCAGMAAGAGRGPQGASPPGGGHRPAAPGPHEHAAAHRRDGALVQGGSVRAARGCRRPLRARPAQTARRGQPRACRPRPHHAIDGGDTRTEARSLPGAAAGDGLLLERGGRRQPGRRPAAAREVAPFHRPRRGLGHEEQPGQGADERARKAMAHDPEKAASGEAQGGPQGNPFDKEPLSAHTQ